MAPRKQEGALPGWRHSIIGLSNASKHLYAQFLAVSLLFQRLLLLLLGQEALLIVEGTNLQRIALLLLHLQWEIETEGVRLDPRQSLGTYAERNTRFRGGIGWPISPCAAASPHLASSHNLRPLWLPSQHQPWPWQSSQPPLPLRLRRETIGGIQCSEQKRRNLMTCAPGQQHSSSIAAAI